MKEDTNNAKACVGIAALTGGISIGVVALIAIFSPGDLAIAGWIVGPLCLMGIALGYLATRSSR